MGFPQIPWDSCDPHPRAGLYCLPLSPSSINGTGQGAVMLFDWERNTDLAERNGSLPLGL